MKKLFFALTIIFSLYSCSSDDKYDLDDAITIKKTELIQVSSSRDLSWIYNNANGNICISFYGADPKSGSPIYTSQGFCPITHSNSQLYNDIIVGSRDGYPDFTDPYFYCRGCKAQFDINTGKAKNSFAEGYQLPVYKAKGDEDLNVFYVWK